MNVSINPLVSPPVLHSYWREVDACVVPLYAHCGAGSAVGGGPIDDVEPLLPFVQAYLEVGIACPWVVLVSPLDVEYPVGGCATNRGEDAKSTVDRVQIVPEREDRIGNSCVGQAAVGEGADPCYELQRAVGIYACCGEVLVVQLVGEG